MSKYDDMTKDELMEEAQRLDIDGRSGMDKAELHEAVVAADAGDESESAESPTGLEAETEPTSQFHSQGAGEGESADKIGDMPEREGTTAGDTDTDPVLDSEADYTEPRAESGDDEGWRIKSRQEEEQEQHDRREAANAKIEETVKAAKTNPW
jgi:hypothetical protein